MAAKIATGTVETPFGVSLRDKLTKALVATGYNAAKVKRVTRYPRVVRWKITPTGAKPTPFGIRIRNKRTGQQFVHVATGQGLSAGEMRIDTPADMQTGDVLEIDQPSGYPSFPYTITFEFEGQQFQTVENRRPVGTTQVPLPQCTFTVVNVDSVDDTINLVDYETAIYLLHYLQSVAVSGSGSASITSRSTSVSADGSVSATANSVDPVGERVCSVTADTDIGVIDDTEFFDPPDFVSASVSAVAQVFQSPSEYRVGGVVVGYSVPFAMTFTVEAAAIRAESSPGAGDSQDFLRRIVVRLTSGLKQIAGVDPVSTEPIVIGGVPLTVQFFDYTVNNGDVTPSASAAISASEISATVQEPEPSIQQATPSTITIPPPPGWPD